jgi:hypothetical protein
MVAAHQGRVLADRSQCVDRATPDRWAAKPTAQPTVAAIELKGPSEGCRKSDIAGMRHHLISARAASPKMPLATVAAKRDVCTPDGGVIGITGAAFAAPDVGAAGSDIRIVTINDGQTPPTGWTDHSGSVASRQAEIFTNFPLLDALLEAPPDIAPLASVSPSLSGFPFTPGGNAEGGPSGGLLNRAWVTPLVRALIALMLSSPDGKQPFAAKWPEGPVVTMTTET